MTGRWARAQTQTSPMQPYQAGGVAIVEAPVVLGALKTRGRGAGASVFGALWLHSVRRSRTSGATLCFGAKGGAW
ncbi:hypothetical protein HaLaN_16349 [Haematococcus lacustris]|uniref:Uncharacterized protein n=1 Tax=Haematococcus lacustris TaxID=44745 RepID=A0A699ZK92_HAELA|nr:hypothetical protein HaLaN_16349 [Haematococcus lacustris]